MLLTLIRHGEAAPAQDGVDELRELTQTGHAQAVQSAEFIQHNVQPDLFVVSPLRRAQQTLAHIQTHFPDVPVLVCDKIKPDDDAKQALNFLSSLTHQNIVVVCHMNVVAHMAARLTDTHFEAFALAEVRVFEQEAIAEGFSTQTQQFIPQA